MIKILFITTVLLSMTSCELLQLKKTKKNECFILQNLHPEQQAICVLQNEIHLLRNSKVKKIVQSYKKVGLRNSNEYKVSLITGGGSGEELFWRYFVSVNFNDFKSYRSIVGIVDISAAKPPKLYKVMSGEDVK